MEQQINEKVMEIAQSVHKTIPVAWKIFLLILP